jgi:hypothetical protein
MKHERRVFLAGVRGPALAAGTEIVAVTTDLTRQKFRDTNLLDRCHVVDDPRTLPAMARHLISVHGQPRAAKYIHSNRPRSEHADGETR